MSELLKIFIAELSSKDDSDVDFSIVLTAKNRDEAVTEAAAYNENFFVLNCEDTGEESNRPFLRLLDTDEDD